MPSNASSITPIPMSLDDNDLNNVAKKSRKRRKLMSPKVEKVVEFKSKWDQFCDYTSLIGFRLLHSKLPQQTRISAGVIMVFAFIMLGYTASGAVKKFFADDTAVLCRFFLVDDYRNEENEIVPWEILPEVRFCHGSQFAQAGIRPKYWENIVDDVRLLLHLHYTNNLAKNNTNSHLPLTGPKDIFSNSQTTEMPRITGTECQKYYAEGRRQCAAINRGRNYCDLFNVQSPAELLLPLSNNMSYFEFTTLLRGKDTCYHDWLSNQNDSNFYCCRLQQAYSKLVEYKKMNFTEYINNVTIATEDHVVISHDAFYTNETVWTPKYGQCISFQHNKREEARYNASELKSIEFILRTNAYDEVGIDGIFGSLVVNGYDANYFTVFPGTLSTYLVKELVAITDNSCADGYPSICADQKDYSLQTCRTCYAARKKCNCYSPLQRGLRREGDAECLPVDAIQCAINTTNTNISLSICPFACKASTYSVINTVIKIDNAPKFKTIYEPIFTSRKERIETARILNRLILALDNTTIPFPAKSHQLWFAVEALTGLMDVYFNLINNLVVLAYGNSTALSDITYNTSGSIDFFDRTLPSSGSTVVDTALRSFWVSTQENAILTSLWNEQSLIDPLVVLARSFEATIILARPVNPPAIINFYNKADNLNGLIDRLNQLCQTLPQGVDPLLSNEQQTALTNILNSFIFEHKPCNASNTSFIDLLRKYLQQYKPMSVIPEDFRTNYVVINFDFSKSESSVVIYDLDYTFWYFLTDVGGMLGLFFGMTLVTLYEIMSFCFIDREPPERHARKALKLTRKTLYPVQSNSIEPLPVIVY